MMYVAVPTYQLAGYGQVDEPEVMYSNVPSTLTVTAERSTDRAIAVTGLTLAFFSTLVLFANLLSARGAR